LTAYEIYENNDENANKFVIKCYWYA